MKSKPFNRISASLRWVVVGMTACAGLVLLPASPVRTASVAIIQPVVENASAVNGGALRPASAATKRSRLIRVNVNPLPTPGTGARAIEDNLELALFPGVTLEAVFERFETIGGSGTWIGHVDGIPMSSVTLAYRDGLLTANINARDTFFQIQPAPDQGNDATRPLHIVSEVDPSALPSGNDVPDVRQDARAASDGLPPGRMLDSGEVIDLMVVYTPRAQARAGGPVGVNNSIALQVADINTAFSNSRMSQRVRLVHTALVSYPESPDFFRSINDLFAGTGGLSGVAGLRNTYGADLVSLFVESLPGANACGVGQFSVLPGLGERYGISVIGDGGCTSVYVLAHELGHNFGARHDWYVDASLTPYPFGKGHVDTTQRWRTVMAYDDMCFDQGFNCPRIRYFSTPQVEYIPFCSNQTFNCDLLRYWFFPGRPLGAPDAQGTGCRVEVIPSTPCAADNRRVLQDTALAVANYRQSR